MTHLAGFGGSKWLPPFLLLLNLPSFVTLVSRDVCLQTRPRSSTEGKVTIIDGLRLSSPLFFALLCLSPLILFSTSALIFSTLPSVFDGQFGLAFAATTTTTTTNHQSLLTVVVVN